MSCNDDEFIISMCTSVDGGTQCYNPNEEGDTEAVPYSSIIRCSKTRAVEDSYPEASPAGNTTVAVWDGETQKKTCTVVNDANAATFVNSLCTSAGPEKTCTRTWGDITCFDFNIKKIEGAALEQPESPF